MIEATVTVTSKKEKERMEGPGGTLFDCIIYWVFAEALLRVYRD